MINWYMRTCLYRGTLLIATAGVCSANSLTVLAGTDSFQTDATRTFIDSFSLPGGFFGSVGGMPSDPVTTPTMHLGGVPGLCSPIVIQPRAGVFQLPDNGPGESAPGAQHSPLATFNNASCDTQVKRLSDATLPNIGKSDTIHIQISALSLKSVVPLAVTYGGASTNLFDLFVNLDPPEALGSMTLTRIGESSGTFTSTLPVNSILTFTNEDASGPAAIAQIHRIDDFTSSNGTFVVTPEPNLLPLIAGLMSFCAYAAKRRKNAIPPRLHRWFPEKSSHATNARVPTMPGWRVRAGIVIQVTQILNLGSLARVIQDPVAGR